MPTSATIDNASGALLSPVTPTVSRIDTGEDLPTVSVSADRIPWYWWLLAGFVTGWAVAHAVRGRG